VVQPGAGISYGKIIQGTKLMEKISAIIITFNAEENIRECLESIKWADEIIIVDSHSKDRTCDIAGQFTDKIVTTDEIRYGEKRNIGIQKASNEWILWIDADERATTELRNEIKQEVLQYAGNNKQEIGFKIKRKTYFINKFIRYCGWYPDFNLRLFKKSSTARFSNARVHEKLLFNGRTIKLRNPIIHFTDLTFEHYIEKMNNYTSLAASDLKEQGASSGIHDIIFRPVLTFFTMYFLRLGILDGFMGLVLCTLSSVSVFTKYSKLYFMK
jgi:glycosyltransferase involved in cell wall biosynthesis